MDKFRWRNHGNRRLPTYLDSRTLVVILIAFALFLDNVLLTTIVPIMPEFLYKLQHPDEDYLPVEKKADAPILEFSSPPVIEPNSSIRSRFNDTLYSAPDQTTTDIGATSISQEARSGYETRVTNEAESTFLENAITATGSTFVDDQTSLPPKDKHTQPKSLEQKRHADLMKETVDIGILLASKPLVQLITIPIISGMMSIIPCNTFILAGFLTIFGSTLIFSFGNSYAVLFFARSLQGVGSACISLVGMSIIAEMYPINEERGHAIAFTFSGLAFGTLIGPTYGGVLYELCGKKVPFLILSSLALTGVCVQLLFIRIPRIKKPKFDVQSLKSVITDPYVLLACIAVTIANMGLALLEPTLPVWMMDTMHARQWQQGAVFLPESVCYLISTYYIGTWGNRFGRWFISMIGLIMLGISFLLLLQTNNFLETIVPMFILGLSMGLIDGTMTPELGYLADIRHSAAYGGVYALEQLAECCGNSIAPGVSGFLVNSIGFKWTATGIATICITYAPFLYFLKNPRSKEENDKLLVC